MINESNYIDGAEAKQLKELCKKYDKVKAEYERAKAEFESITAGIKKLCTAKLNESADYIVKMTITDSYYTLDTKQIKAKFPELAETYKKLVNGNSKIYEILKK